MAADVIYSAFLNQGRCAWPPPLEYFRQCLETFLVVTIGVGGVCGSAFGS